MSTGEHHENHGNSVAAWTAVSVVTLGFVVGAFAFLVAQPWVFWVGVGVVVLGVVLGKVLAMMGFGVHHDAAAHEA
jgi:hypothetical protein